MTTYQIDHSGKELLRSVGRITSALVATMLLASGCGANRIDPAIEGSADVKTIATDLSPAGSRAVFLYFRDGDHIVQTRCPDGERGRTRDRCTLDRKTVDATWLLSQLGQGVGTGLPGFDQHAREIYIRVADIDTRLIEFLGTDVDPSSQANLNRSLRDIEARIAVIEINIRQFDIQINATESRIAQGANADLLSQIALLRRQRGLEAKSRDEQETLLREARKAYVDQNGQGLSDRNYLNLLARRAEMVTELQTVNASIDAELGRVVALRSVIEMLEDAQFTSEVLTSSTTYAEEKEFVAKFEGLFGVTSPLPDTCEGVSVPGDYASLSAAFRALGGVGGTICVGPGVTGSASSLDTSSVATASQLSFTIVGSGMEGTQLGTFDFDAFQVCSGCSLTLRDLTLSGTARFRARGNSTTLRIERVRSNQQLFISYASGAVTTVDRLHAKSGLRVSCMDARTGSVSITNSVIQGNNSSALVVDRFNDSSRCDVTTKIVNNTITGAATGLMVAEGSNVEVRNNLIARNQIGINLLATAGWIVRNNALTGNATNYAGFARPGEGYVAGADLGIDFSSPIPRLLVNSPLRSAGLRDSAPTHDFFGRPRDTGIDIGAVQY